MARHAPVKCGARNPEVARGVSDIEAVAPESRFDGDSFRRR